MNRDTGIEQLIICTPYKEPDKYWKYNEESQIFVQESGRRPAGYVASQDTKDPYDLGVFIPIEPVNKIRQEISTWRVEGYRGVTPITRKLLDWWSSRADWESKRFFFCQIEAIETLIWLTEIYKGNLTKEFGWKSDGGDFTRFCSKMATGTGKTVVMAMLIAWQILNKVNSPTDSRFSKNIFIVSPGITVRERLKVLIPSDKNNFYDEFNVIPPGMRSSIYKGKVMISNWQSLGWDSEEKVDKRKGVDKRGPISDVAYAKEVLGDMVKSLGIVVINDEAHHAWRMPSYKKRTEYESDDIDEATKWIGALDRINKVVGIRNCFDFTATPFWPSGKKSTSEDLFPWIVSDFGLSDAIESGLVKTPQVAFRDDAMMTPDKKPLLYHIYGVQEVKENLNEKSTEEKVLPDFVTAAYSLLSKDWNSVNNRWLEEGSKVPPVMISVVNRTETAARVKYSFDHKWIPAPQELYESDKTLHIDSKVLEMADEIAVDYSVDSATDDDEENAKPKSKAEKALHLREQVNTIGKEGKPGEKIQHVISVGMLSEGWDAKTITHIMGLRAFTSQLLCEQVVGRGLRRTSYEVNPETGLYEPEYVNVFGIPFRFLPHEGTAGPRKKDQKPTVRTFADEEKSDMEIRWPNVLRIETIASEKITFDLDKVELLELDFYKTPTVVELGWLKDSHIEEKARAYIEQKSDLIRLQSVMFAIVQCIHIDLKNLYGMTDLSVTSQLFKIVESFINSDKLKVKPVELEAEFRDLMIALNMQAISQRILQYIIRENESRHDVVLDTKIPFKSTGMMPDWFTRKATYSYYKTHMNKTVVGSDWEKIVADDLERNSKVVSWVKNDHLGFEVLYNHNGTTKRYIPDFIVKLTNGLNLVIEVKGEKREKDFSKFFELQNWCKALSKAGLGQWECSMCDHPNLAGKIVDKYSK